MTGDASAEGVGIGGSVENRTTGVATGSGRNCESANASFGANGAGAGLRVGSAVASAANGDGGGTCAGGACGGADLGEARDSGVIVGVGRGLQVAALWCVARPHAPSNSASEIAATDRRIRTASLR